MDQGVVLMFFLAPHKRRFAEFNLYPYGEALEL